MLKEKRYLFPFEKLEVWQLAKATPEYRSFIKRNKYIAPFTKGKSKMNSFNSSTFKK